MHHHVNLGVNFGSFDLLFAPPGAQFSQFLPHGDPKWQFGGTQGRPGDQISKIARSRGYLLGTILETILYKFRILLKCENGALAAAGTQFCLSRKLRKQRKRLLE